MEKNDIARKLAEELGDIKDMAVYEELLKDNTITFKVQEKEYRVRRMKLVEKQEVFQQKAKKFGELSGDKDWKFRDQIIEEAKKKGYDLDKINKRTIKLQIEIDDAFERLAKMSEDTRIKKAKQDLNSLLYEQAQISQKQTDLFQFSIEDYLEFYVKSYLGYLVTEIKKKDEWIKLFNSYDELQNSTEYELIKYISAYVNYLIRAGELG